MKTDCFKIISRYMPLHIREALERVKDLYCKHVSEIRLRVNRGVALYSFKDVKYLCKEGRLTTNLNDSNILIAAAGDISHITEALCRYSIHSSRRELSQCYFTIENGIRVGAAGSFSDNGNGLKNVTSLNFRISREIIGASDEIYNSILKNGISSILICGGVNSGKTTLLRDLSRRLGEYNKTVLIDERNELSASVNGIPTIEIGFQTDVLVGCNRSEGIITAVRVLSPHIIICDEIANKDDCEAILSGFGSGVKFISSLHATSFKDVMSRDISQTLISKGVFDYAVIMEGESFPGKIKEIRRLKNDIQNGRIYYDSTLRRTDW